MLEVFPTGGMLWHYRHRLNGKQERDKRETVVAQGRSSAVQRRLAKQGAAPGTTVAEFGERFFREVVAKDRQDLTIPRRYFDKSIVAAIGTPSDHAACRGGQRCNNGTKREWCPASLATPGSPRRLGRTETLTWNDDTE